MTAEFGHFALILAFAVALLLVTFLHVTFGEMVPKNISVSVADRAALLEHPGVATDPAEAERGEHGGQGDGGGDDLGGAHVASPATVASSRVATRTGRPS